MTSWGISNGQNLIDDVEGPVDIVKRHAVLLDAVQPSVVKDACATAECTWSPMSFLTMAYLAGVMVADSCSGDGSLNRPSSSPYEGSQALAFQKAEQQAYLAEKLNEKVVQTNSLRMFAFVRRLLQIGRHQRRLLAL